MLRTLSYALAAAVLAGPAQAGPLAEKYLLDGKLAEGRKALEKRLAEKPDDDEARFGLAVVEFLGGFERLGTSLYKHGLKTSTAFNFAPLISRHAPENPKPERLTHEGLRKIAEAWVADVNRAGATLDDIKDDKVKLKLPVGKIKIDLFGVGKPVSAAILLGATDAQAAKAAEAFTIAFDRGDVNWLRGYCHFFAAWGELFLALDTKERFDCTAHRFFGGADTPFAFLKQEKTSFKGFDFNFNDSAVISDLIAFIHLSLRVPVKEPERLKVVLKHLEGMVANGKAMWKHILSEADDDHEWVPNPKQNSVVGVKVTQDMIDEWRLTLDEVDLVLKGKRMLPFWRGIDNTMGVNLRKAFTEPAEELDLVKWVQGTAAAPYLEKGPITALADQRRVQRLNQAFGGVGFFGFAFWFN